MNNKTDRGKDNLVNKLKLQCKKVQNNKNLKSACGITLVALVITIIIIIILATITMNMAFGDNGLITQAQKAKDMAANSVIAEQEGMNSLMGEFANVMGEDSSNAELLTEALKKGEIAVGDYVDYKPEAHASVTVGTSETGYTNSKGMSEGTDQTFSQNASTTWRILGLSEDSQHVLLTSGSPIKKDGDDPYLVLESYIGADNCVNVLNKVSSLYHNSTLAEETRSMTIKDIENVLGGVTVTYPTEENPNTGTVTLNADSSHTDISAFVSLPSYTYETGDYTLTNPPQSATAGTKINGDAYGFIYNYEAYQSLGIDIDKRTYDMLFAGTTDEDNNAKSYWLASPGVYALSGYACFGPGVVFDGDAYSGGNNLFGSDGGWYAGGCAVRPVVVLKSNIKVDQIHKIEDPVEEQWSTEGGNDYGNGWID